MNTHHEPALTLVPQSKGLLSFKYLASTHNTAGLTRSWQELGILLCTYIQCVIDLTHNTAKFWPNSRAD
jgi:hypothetical protein